ncbi:integral peroxisomal membrane peroxin-domain-containing protein [Phellopilus nigrolimitatus]|nr:integral peroxisomal membrane peroxin-domain-containing protein [Phellopilus nigrolimitatus]
MSSSTTSSPSRANFDLPLAQPPTLPTLITFLNSVPPQLTTLLAELGPYIARIRWFVETVSWKTKYADSWLLLGVWWLLCLLSGFTLKYLLPVVAAAIYVYLSYLQPPSRVRAPVTEQSLQSTIIDLSVIESLLPSTPHPQTTPWKAIIRILAILYIPFLLVTHFVRLRVLLGVFGTVLVIWRAHWANTARATLWRSAWFRRSLSSIWAILSGQSPSPVILSASSWQSGETGHSIRFLITVYENQRWWVGLDWTAALLPGERPSWCSSALEPLSPPSAFTLPEPTCVYVSDGKGGLVKRTASWTWEEGEWKVVVKKEDANRVGRIRQKVHGAKLKLKTSREGDSGDVELDSVRSDTADTSSSISGDAHDTEAEEPLTDNDGWMYGDNKWTAVSSNGGLGKFTRYRKWTRIALLSEVIEAASAEEARSHAARQQETSMSSADAENRAGITTRLSLDSSQSRRSIDENEDTGDDGGLRKRLKAAIRKSTV